MAGAAVGAAAVGAGGNLLGGVIQGEYNKSINNSTNESNQKIAKMNNDTWTLTTDKNIQGQKDIQKHTEDQFTNNGLPSYMAYQNNGGNDKLPHQQYHLGGNNYYQSGNYGSSQPSISNNYQQFNHVGVPSKFENKNTGKQKFVPGGTLQKQGEPSAVPNTMVKTPFPTSTGTQTSRSGLGSRVPSTSNFQFSNMDPKFSSMLNNQVSKPNKAFIPSDKAKFKDTWTQTKQSSTATSMIPWRT